MGRFIGCVIVATICGWLGISCGVAFPSQQKGVSHPILVADLHPKLYGKEVTVTFTIIGLGGISQRFVEGQGQSFIIKTESGKNRLSVWIEGELANVLDHLQMSFTQENQLKVGTTIVATGFVTSIPPGSYSLSVKEWGNFRILPSMKKSGNFQILPSMKSKIP